MNMRNGIRAALVLAALCLSMPALAEMKIEKVDEPDVSAPEKKSGDAPEYKSGSFSVTPVEDCFSRLKPGEAAEVRRDFDSPWMECQRRLREREEGEKKTSSDKEKETGKSGDGKDGKGGAEK